MSVTPQQAQSMLNTASRGARYISPYVPYAGAASPYLGNAASLAGVYGGLQRGGFQGYGGAAANAGNLYGKLSGDTSLNPYAGGLSNVLGIYGGIKQGGVQGYGRAAGSGLQLAGQLGASSGLMSEGLSGALGTAGGYVAAPLALYNAINNYQSGDTGGDTLRGAEAGAAIGSVVPVLGTVVGGLVGGAAGALSSAFGPGAKDPETAIVQRLIDATGANPKAGSSIAAGVQNPYLQLAGLMDRHESTLPMYQQYGRMGEQKFTNDMTGKINQALTSGQIDKNTSSQDIYNKVVAPWVNSMGSGWNNVGQAYKDTTQGLLQDMTNQYVSGGFRNDWKAIGGDSPFANTPGFGGTAAPVARPMMRGRPMMMRHMRMAEGGIMDPYRMRQLQEIYRGSFKDRQFADGGFTGYYGNYYSNPSIPSYTDPATARAGDSGSGSSIGDQYSPPPANIPTIDPGALQNPYGEGALNNPYDQLYSQGPGATQPVTQGGLSGLLGKGGDSISSVLGSLKDYAPLIPILQSLMGGNKGARQPSLPSQYTGQIYNIPTPASTRQATNPQMSMQDWLTYGERPEQQFYTNNQLPTTPMSPPNVQSQSAPAVAPGHATIQPVSPYGRPVMARGGPYDSPQMAYGPTAHYIRGPGDGTSDDINAKLSDGEYVIDAPTVSLLGNGSNEAGARQLDRFRRNVRQHAGRKLVRGKQPMKAKNPEDYIEGEVA